jgi:CheY-like chemotaxis protein
MGDARTPVVLVADDHEDTRTLFVFALEQAGFIAHGAATVAEARELLDALRPDVLVADYSLPDGTGADLVELCAAARPKVCILITGHRAAEIEATGFHVVLQKPIVSGKLVETIRAHVASS